MRQTLLLLLLTGVAQAQEMKFGGVLFGQGVMTTSPRSSTGGDSKGRDAFDVTRIYLSAEGKFEERWKLKMVLEANTNGTSAGQTNNDVFLKQAFLEYATPYNLSVQGGQIPTSWDALESETNRRYIMKAFADSNGLIPTADKGVGAYGNLPGDYGRYNSQITNGSGVQATEGTTGASGRQKAYSLLLSAKLPSSPLALNLYLQQEQQGIVSTVAGEGLLHSREKNRLIAGPSLKGDTYHLTANYFYAPTATGTKFADNTHTRPQGYSLHGSYKFWKDLTAFARFDRYDPGTGLTYEPKRTSLFAIERQMNKYIKMALANINTSSRNVNENTLGAYAEAKF